MEITHPNMIPGLLTKDIEFVAVSDGIVDAFHDRSVLSFDQLPAFAYDTIRKSMCKVDATLAEMQRFVYEVWGGLDRNPDIYADGTPGPIEYLPHQQVAPIDEANIISKAQLRILKLIHLDDKAIAEELFLSQYTVSRHCQDLYVKAGVKSRTQLALWAKNKGII